MALAIALNFLIRSGKQLLFGILGIQINNTIENINTQSRLFPVFSVKTLILAVYQVILRGVKPFRSHVERTTH